ncbi:MAG: hypothetical protein ACQESX_00765 [Bacteroidota bacterium]
MKKFKTLFPVAVLSMLILFSGCEELDDTDPDTDPRDDFVGEWNCNEVPAKRNSYRVVINYDNSNSSQVLLFNFGLLGQSASAYGVVAGNDVTVPLQEIDGDWTVDGQGEMIDEETIEWTYTIDDGADRTDYIATFTLIE